MDLPWFVCVSNEGVTVTFVSTVCRGYGKLFSCNVAVVIQGECEQELPEKVLMCFTINKVRMFIWEWLFIFFRECVSGQIPHIAVAAACTLMVLWC